MLRTAARAAAGRTAALSGARGIVTAKLPDLPYDFGALEPVISGEIMKARTCQRPPRAPACPARALTSPRTPLPRSCTTPSTMPRT